MKLSHTMVQGKNSRSIGCYDYLGTGPKTREIKIVITDDAGTSMCVKLDRDNASILAAALTSAVSINPLTEIGGE